MMRTASLIAASALVSSAAMATLTDGVDIPTDFSGNLLETQTSATGFGDATTPGTGSELDQMFGYISGGNLHLGITGNLETNFNKMFILFDAVVGGEKTLGSDNADGGFGEINQLAGMTFSDPNFAADHMIRLEIGGGYMGVNGGNLIDNTAFTIFSNGGSLPVSGVGSGGVTLGWDNSNVLGVDGSSPAGANTATTGWEFEIDMNTFFGATPTGVGVVALITSGDGTFVSNQVLPGIPFGGPNIGGDIDTYTSNIALIGDQLPEIPEPATFGLLTLGGALLGRRRR